MDAIRLPLGPLLGVLLALTAGGAQAEGLMDIYQLAAGNDPRILGAEAQREAAQEALKQSTANFLPSINFSAGRTETNQNVTKSAFGPAFTGERSFNTTSYALSLNLSLYNKDNYAARRLAKATASRADAEYEAARQELMLRLAEAYFGVLAAQDNVEFARAEQRAVKRQLDQTQQRFEVGLVAITDVHESRARYDLAEAEVINADNALDNSIETLRAITGSYPNQLAKLGDDITLARPDPEDIDQWTRTALAQNPALLAREAALKEARETVARQRSGHYPALDLTANRFFDERGGIFANTTETVSVGVNLNLPLYAGGRTSSLVRQALHLQEASRQALEEQRRATQRQARNAYLGVLSAISRVKALKQALMSNQSALRAAEAGYEVGTRTTVDVLLARRNLYSAQRDYAQSRYDYILNSLRLQQAAGQLTVDSLKAISGWLR